MSGGVKFYEATPQNKRIKGGSSGKMIYTWGVGRGFSEKGTFEQTRMK